jgi:DNA-binding Xre family transcriptional regulator
MGFQIYIKLREAVLAYKRRTGEPMTYEILARRTGLSEGTLQNIGGSRKTGANLSTLAKICGALHITPGDLLELVEDPPQAKPRSKRTAKKK